jgi:hypothetical protein
MRRTIEKFAQSHGVALNVVVEMDALAQIKQLVARGSGFTILGAAAAQDRIKKLRVCVLVHRQSRDRARDLSRAQTGPAADLHPLRGRANYP